MANIDFLTAIEFIESGDVSSLKQLLVAHPELATETDDSNATLLIRLIDWPGKRPNSADTAQTLLKAGAKVDARRNDENGTPLSGAVCTEEVDVIRVLLDAGANIHAPCGWQSGSVLEQVDQLCENYQRSNEKSFRNIASLFSESASRPVPLRTPIGGPVPLLFVSNFEAGLKFYTECLGFRLAWRYDVDPTDPYASIVRGNADFHLTECNCQDNVHVGRLYVRIPATDVDALHAEFVAANAKIIKTPYDQPWGLREFEIEDLDGNRLVFFQFMD